MNKLRNQPELAAPKKASDLFDDSSDDSDTGEKDQKVISHPVKEDDVEVEEEQPGVQLSKAEKRR